MYNNLDRAVQLLYIIIALNLAFMVILYAIKLRGINNRKLHDRFQAKFKDYLTYIQVNIHGADPLKAPPWTMNQVEKETMLARLSDMIECFSGEQRKKLIRLCEDLGFVQHYLARLNHGSNRVKLDAAYHLGCMRVKEAAPALLEMLKDHPLNSALFIVARALAKCARDGRDIRTMVELLLQHDKNFYELIVSIITDSEQETASLYTEYVNSPHPVYIRIGLIGLSDCIGPAAASAVYRLIDSEHEDIQIKAVEVYLKSPRLLPIHIAEKLLSHTNFDIRRLVIDALSGIKNPAYVELMKGGLMDSEHRVVHMCVKGLLRMGEDGMAVLCERAAATQGTERGQFLQQLIDEELRHLSMQLHHLDKLTQYNTLLYIYNKIIRKNKRIYRVV